jgi:hypothetical protein
VPVVVPFQKSIEDPAARVLPTGKVTEAAVIFNPHREPISAAVRVRVPEKLTLDLFPNDFCTNAVVA